MKSIDHDCDSQRIDDYLNETLSQSGQSELEEHLSICEQCQGELERRAAEPMIWSDAVSLLGERTGEFADAATGETGRQAFGVLDSLSPTDDPEMLGRIGDYEISGVVGVGGMGAVLKGLDRSLRRVVAIKVMAPHLANSGSARARFQREARAAAAITHDNVIDIYSVAEANGLPYLVMPYARGPSLQRRIDDGGPLAVAEVIRIGRQIAAGLAAAHEQGLVHRDIKPANILLSDGIERLWITDFGVARAMDDASMTKTGVIAGTPQYMSPEQARGEAVDQRSDLFSLGSILYTTCTGRPPFRSEAAYGILRRITDTDPRPIREINPDVPDWLCRIIEKLMAKHPADRFESATEVAELLETCLAHLQQPTQVELPPCLTTRQEKVMPTLVQSATDTSGAMPRAFRFSRKGVWIMISTLVLAGLGVFAIQATSPADVSGRWTGERWTNVSLASVEEAADWYTGTFTDDQGRRGAVRLEWTRTQRRYNGRWRVGDKESGSITLRVSNDGIVRGAVSIDPDSNVGADTPHLREFSWTRATSANDELEPSAQQQVQSSRRSLTIRSPINGVVTKRGGQAIENGRIQVGELVVVVTPSDQNNDVRHNELRDSLRRKVEYAEAMLDASMRNRESEKAIVESLISQLKTLDQVKEQTISAAAASIAAAEQELAATRQVLAERDARLEQLEALAADNSRDAQVIEKESAKLEAAKAAVREANANLIARRNDRISQEQKAQVDVNAATTAFKKAEADYVKSETEVLKARAALLQAKTELNAHEADRQEQRRISIVAPVDGTLTQLVPIDGQKTIREGDVICVIVPDNSDESPAPERRDDATTNSRELSSNNRSLAVSGNITLSLDSAGELAGRMRSANARIERESQAISMLSEVIDRNQAAIVEIQKKMQELEQGAAEDALSEAELERRSLQAELKVHQAQFKALQNKLGAARAERDDVVNQFQTTTDILKARLAASQARVNTQQQLLAIAQQKYRVGQATIDAALSAQQAMEEAIADVRQIESLLQYLQKHSPAKRLEARPAPENSTTLPPARK